MNKELVAFVYLAIVLFVVTTTNAKGGRSSGGRGSSGRSSNGRRGNTRSISNSGSSRSSSSHNFNGYYNNVHYRNGFFHNFFYNSPYRLSHRSTYISSNHLNVNSYSIPDEDREVLYLDEDKYATGFSISRALNGDFSSVFQVVHNIAKYPEKIKNKEFLTTTTTEVPVTTPNVIKVTEPTYIRSSPTTYNYPWIIEDDLFKFLDLLRTKDKKQNNNGYNHWND